MWYFYSSLEGALKLKFGPFCSPCSTCYCMVPFLAEVKIFSFWPKTIYFVPLYYLQISCVSASKTLSNRNRFRSYFQLLATENTLAGGFFGIIRKYGWQKIGIITQNENLFTQVCSTIDSRRIHYCIYCIYIDLVQLYSVCINISISYIPVFIPTYNGHDPSHALYTGLYGTCIFSSHTRL